jgi:hypothetical protein
VTENRIYLTVGKDPKGHGLLAVISQGQPRYGDAQCTVLSVTVVPNMKAAKRWYNQEMLKRPWETRQ